MKIWPVFLSALLLIFPPLAVSKTETLTLHHDSIDAPLNFTVYLPDTYDPQGDQRYHLLFDYHPLAGRYLEGLQFWLSHNGNTPWPSTIIVTPEPGNRSGMLFAPEKKATPLADFIAYRLLPALEKQYRLTGFRMFNGFRHNGTIGLSMLVNHPQSFQAYFIGCPELKDNFNHVLSDIVDKADNIPPYRYVLLSCADSQIKTAHTMNDITELRDMLANIRPLHSRYQDLTGHAFMSFPVRTLLDGLEWVFDEANNGLPGNSAVSAKGMTAIIREVARLSKEKYGVTLSPFLSLQNRGNWLLENNRTNDALSFFTEVATHFPNDAYSWYNLARAQLQADKLDKAIVSQQRAVALATENRRTWHVKKMQAYLKTLRSHLKTQSQGQSTAEAN
ncbi:tetratricopeptide repeat protein [Alteromonas sp. H39]|uniref:tetratricopeptide repeat protein n=1 Tax=Alteromonas sp. H39 TaxID=3389876 RepID=UPI0039E0E846